MPNIGIISWIKTCIISFPLNMINNDHDNILFGLLVVKIFHFFSKYLVGIFFSTIELERLVRTQNCFIAIIKKPTI